MSNHRLTFGVDRLSKDGQPIFDPPPSTFDENSQAAAQSVVGSAGTLRRIVAECIAAEGPIAEWQIEQALGLAGNTVRPRIWELSRAGVIDRHPAKGRTPSGRACWRYVVTDSWHDRLGELTP